MKLSELQQTAWDISESKGFNDKGKATFGDRIALVHSELSEALEAYRGGSEPNVSWKDPDDGKPEGVPSELADVVIRVAHMCALYGINLEEAVKEKLEYNKTRPYMHGGKRL